MTHSHFRHTQSLTIRILPHWTTNANSAPAVCDGEKKAKTARQAEKKVAVSGAKAACLVLIRAVDYARSDTARFTIPELA